jgi:hypothetical protein
MAIVNAIGTIIMAIVNGIVALFDIIIGCKLSPRLLLDELSETNNEWYRPHLPDLPRRRGKKAPQNGRDE